MTEYRKILKAGQPIDIPVSFGIFRKGVSRRHTTGFIQAEFVEYLDDDQANIRYGTDVFTVSIGQIIPAFVDEPEA